jgi:hypothetical protein
MMTLFLLLVLLITAALIWFQGLWGAAIALVNLTFAMLIATNLFEPICSMIEGIDGSITYLLDFLVLWMIFVPTFLFLRMMSHLFSGTRVKFILPVEMAGRTILALWCGWMMVCFTAFSLMMAPLNAENPLGAFAGPKGGSFLGMAPERMWLGFAHSRSRGALSRGNFSGESHPDDANLNVEAFDPRAEFPIKYHDRRVKYATESEMRVAR